MGGRDERDERDEIEETEEVEETEEQESQDDTDDDKGSSDSESWDKMRGIINEEVSKVVKGEFTKWLRAGKSNSPGSSQRERNSQQTRRRGFLEELFNPKK